MVAAEERSRSWGWAIGVLLVALIGLLGLVAWQPDLFWGGGHVRVVMEPREAVVAGAQWRVAGTWRQEESLASADMGADLMLEFREVPGWIAPAPVSVPRGRGEHVVQVAYQRQQLEAKTILRLAGSNTIGADMAPEWAIRYLRHLGADDVRVVQGSDPVEKTVEGIFSQKREVLRIEIKAHGSSTSFKALKEGTADVGMSSRRIKEKERDELIHLGDLMTPEHEHVVALDGIAVIVPRSSPLQSLTRKQVADIFAGRITDWKDFGLPPGPISVHARDDKSGTFDTFKELVLGKDPLVPTAKRYESTAELSDTVAATPGAIGFVGLPYIDKSKELAIADEGLPIKPSPFTVSTEDYPLARRLYLYTPTNPSSGHAKKFVEFVLSKDGQQGVTKYGFVSLDIAATRLAQASAPVPTPSSGEGTSKQAAPAVQQADPLAGIQFINPQVGKAYRDAVQGAERLPLNFRFQFGQFALDSRAVRDVERLVELMQANPNRQLILVGFSDAIGDYNRNLQLSKQRADTVAEELRRRGMTVHTVVAAGKEAPVASNDDPVGRERNRRVEVWLR
jgi:phosphate transport system substrate-binding protein